MSAATGRAISHLRWRIAGLLFASTVINYIDRQALNVLAPDLKLEYGWTNSDFARIVIAFRIAYALFQSLAGRWLDRLGTRRGLMLAVAWYSAAAMLTSTARGWKSFALFRFLLGCGEAANWPAAAKAVAEWFPKTERGLAVALYDSGSAVGGAVAPSLVVWLRQSFGSWRPAFLITGMLGFLWLLAWRALYYPPQRHPRLGEAERAKLDAARRQELESEAKAIPKTQTEAAAWRSLLALRQTWGIVLGRALTDPVWFFITDWFAIFLAAKGFSLESSLMGFWIPFLAADLGNLSGGGASSLLIRRGWSVLQARKAVIVVGGVGMAMLIPAAFLNSFWAIIALFALATFGYAAWSTMALTLPSDLYPSASVATVSGLSGTAAGIGTIVSTYLIGRVSDRYSFAPILITASLVPLAATGLVLWLVQGKPAQGK